MTVIPNYWSHEHLPDGTRLPSDMTNVDGVIHGWTGRPCPKCNGTGEDFTRDDGGTSHRYCGGTGEFYGPIYCVEE